ncbi:hypothetical protein NPIRD3C_0962 [Nitrosopumilus piranensis]|uniref:Uncharacterized protein n=1 Tax=Nitrosopumilus piranensis TaxID=1582439 RepID=A0A0C5BVC4_9ARCH|nr:hypothetical protein NPIRD3C_0962 [Nitrosopumilus piranensis]
MGRRVRERSQVFNQAESKRLCSGKLRMPQHTRTWCSSRTSERQTAIQNATPEEFGQVLEVFEKLNIGKTDQAKK